MRNKIREYHHLQPLFIFLLIFIISDWTLSATTPAKLYEKDTVCSKNMFLCTSTKRCIPQEWVCDQERDCQEGEDEDQRLCENDQTKCSDNEYPCQTTSSPSHGNPWLAHLTSVDSIFSHHCIPKSWVCDGEVDCLLRDDEANCPKVNCSKNHFECKSFDSSATSCIPIEWVCDGQIDCLHEEDEKNCTSTAETNKCDEKLEFTCKREHQCIYKAWRCDGDYDCKDRTDEENCVEEACKEADKFKCKGANICISNTWRCDGEPDCPDHSDEQNCTRDGIAHYAHEIKCADKEFQCANRAQCISIYWRCDGDEDCFDGSDESNCPEKCRPGQMACKSGHCIDATFWCDGNQDCLDKSDEANCTSTVVPPKSSESCDAENQYTCPGETPLHCINYDQLCDGDSSNDCTTRSVCGNDIIKCNEKVSNGACNCRRMGRGKNQGKLCHCENGFRTVNSTCIDIDECQKTGVCDQKCINMQGTYRCECYPGYKLTSGVLKTMSDGAVAHKCRAVGSDPVLLLANRAAIRQYDMITNNYHPLISQLESAVALDYWHENKTLVWSDVSKEQIMICSGVTGLGNRTLFDSINQNCTDSKHNLVKISENVTTPDGLAIDWVHGLLFWTDTGTDTINVYDFNTKRRTVLINNGLDEPRAIAVDPVVGLIFWTDWGQHARIERAGMDGKDRLIIVDGNTIRWPNGLTVDILDKRLYWADAKTKQISSCDYWGKNIRVVLHSHEHLRHPFSLAVFEERLYWTDWDREGVLSVNKFNGSGVKQLMHGVAGPMTVRVYHQQAQPNYIKNKCEFHNCHHICLPTALYKSNDEATEKQLRALPYTCACEHGFRVDINNSSLCIPLNPINALSEVVVKSIEHINDDKMSSATYYFVGIFFVCAFFAAIYFYQQKRPQPFAAIHFDNPIYRRTVEADLDADLENLPDNSLGPISILPIGGDRSAMLNNANLNTTSTTMPGGHDSQQSTTKLVLAVPVQKKEKDQNGAAPSMIMVDTSNPHEYGYDQPPPPPRM